MTYWKDVPDAKIPHPGDSWDRPRYDAISALPHDELLRVAWNFLRALEDAEMGALDLAQDLSCEFEMCDYTHVKPEFRHEVSLERQERGIGYMRRAYELAGFSTEKRGEIARIAGQFGSRFKEEGA